MTSRVRTSCVRPRASTTLPFLGYCLVITFSTSPTDYQPIKKLRETRFNGKTWELLDELN